MIIEIIYLPITATIYTSVYNLDGNSILSQKLYYFSLWITAITINRITAITINRNLMKRVK